MGQTVDLATANEEVIQWLNNVAHERIHDTTKQKPADRLIEERQALQDLTHHFASTTPVVMTELSKMTYCNKESLHHERSIYDQLAEAI